ncbi:hypothetical protein HWV62_41801, partial [Athelia sp. TMB]
MNNLLRTLTAHTGAAAEPGLKLLLTTVKDARRGGAGDGKLHDPFYDSLEGLLADLRAVTMDNRDAEAFLKPVARADVPDYYDVIQNPMDLATMGRKVKQKAYKSKREFRDDLDLIWGNCWTYNATENHPLRQCATRLKAKAERLLASITDRKERTDPPVTLSHTLNTPGRISLPPKGRPAGSFDSKHGEKGKHPVSASTTQTSRPAHAHHRSTPSTGRVATSISTNAGPSNTRVQGQTARFDLSAPFGETPALTARFDLSAPFGETPALVRTPAGMRTFSALLSEGIERDRGDAMDIDADENGAVGDKRKLNGYAVSPRKRSRSHDDAGSEEWWERMGSAEMLANGMPGYRFSPTSSQFASSSTSAVTLPKSNVRSPRKIRKKSKKSKKPKQDAKSGESSLLSLMSANIATLARVRRTHTRFAALQADPEPDPDAPGSLALPGPSGPSFLATPMYTFTRPKDDVEAEADAELEAELEAARAMEAQREVWAGARRGELNGEAAGACINWMSGTVLAHAGFQGAARSAMDVLAGVAGDYLLNVGRTIKLLGDRYGRGGMSAEEIILHTLFESGTTRIQDLERYIKDDVVRYGTRLTDLEKKLVGAYRDASVAEVMLDDDALFGEGSDEEEDGAFVMGNFASDALGDDFLGLRELGIAAEFGMSNLSVPKKLLRAKKQRVEGSTPILPKEPPLPYPLPPPFIQLDLDNVDHQIGLLKPYYLERLSHLPSANPHLSAVPPSLTSPSASSIPPPLPPAPAPAADQVQAVGGIH